MCYISNSQINIPKRARESITMEKKRYTTMVADKASLLQGFLFGFLCLTIILFHVFFKYLRYLPSYQPINLQNSILYSLEYIINSCILTILSSVGNNLIGQILHLKL